MFFLKSLTEVHIISEIVVRIIYDHSAYLYLGAIFRFERTKINMAK